jgi:hypothetical protein
MSNMYHLGFGRHDDPTALPVSDRLLLLNSVLFVDDGINERGVSVALASVPPEPIHRDENKKLVAVSYAIREILDHAGSVEEAIAIVRGLDVFDQDVGTISHHFLVADATGQSAVTEYIDGQWRVLRTGRPWQVATNTALFQRSETWVRSQCGRYRAGSDYLEAVGGTVTWKEGFDVLGLMSVADTQWSSLYDLANREAYICLYRRCERIFRVSGVL